MVNVLIPMAGQGSRFIKAGIGTPKPFIEILGKPMIIRVLENLRGDNTRFILIARQEHMESEKETVRMIKENYNVTFIPINQVTEGAACTALFARDFINNNEPLVIANSDQIVDMDFQAFVEDCLDRALDGSIMTFKDPYKDTRWSFASVDAQGFVKEVREKVAISDMATVGIYMFRKGSFYVDAAVDMIIRNDRVNNEFYVCPVYNYAIKNGNEIGIYDIKFEQMHGVGTPEDLEQYIHSINNAAVS